MAKTSTGNTVTQQFAPVEDFMLDAYGVRITDQDWINGRVSVRVNRSIDIDRSIYLTLIQKFTGYKIKSFNDIRNVEDTK